MKQLKNKIMNFGEYVNESHNSNITMLFSELNKRLRNAKIVIDGDILKISKKDNPINFLEIYQAKDYNPNKMSDNRFGINIVVGTIEKPSKKHNSRWYNYGDKYYDLNGVLDVVKRYGIE